MGDFTEALRRAKTDANGTSGDGNSRKEPSTSANESARESDWTPLPAPSEPEKEEELDRQIDQERACQAPIAPPWETDTAQEPPEAAQESPEEEAEQVEILRSKHGFWKGRAVLVDNSEAVAGCYRHFALRVREELEKRQTTSVLVTSPLRREGKTVTACNLALALASMGPGRRVALLDLDFRSPSVFVAMGFAPKVGVDSVLAGRASLTSACVHTDVASLDLIPAYSQTDPHELLANAALPALFRELARRYDTIVCDTPPVLPVPDVPLILPHVGAWLAVARTGVTRCSAFSQMLDLLPQQKLIGTFLNCAPATRHGEQYLSLPAGDRKADAPDAH